MERYDIIKFDKPGQFPKDEIVNENDRIVRSWATVEVRDNQKDIVGIDGFKKVMNTWFKRGAVMMDQHSNRHIGRGLSWKLDKHPKTGKQGILLDYQIFDDYGLDDDVWNDIKSGKRQGLSMGGRALGKPELKMDSYTGKEGKYIKGIELFEISPVDSPANKFSENVAVNYLAKGYKLDESPREFLRNLCRDLNKGYASVDLDKPYAGFSNYDGCYRAQLERNHSPESAKRITNWLMHRTNEEFREDKKEEDKEKTDIDKKVERRGDKWVVVHCEGPKEGQVIGTHDSKEDAEAQHRAIEANKADERPPKEWFDRTVKALKERGGVDDPEALAGWIWHHQMVKSEEINEDLTSFKNGEDINKNKEGNKMNDQTDNLNKGKVYLEQGEKPPEGANVQQGSRGGYYYEDTGKKPDKKPTKQGMSEELMSEIMGASSFKDFTQNRKAKEIFERLQSEKKEKTVKKSWSNDFIKVCIKKNGKKDLNKDFVKACLKSKGLNKSSVLNKIKK